MAQTTTNRHPVRGAVWGLILGLGVFVYLTLVFAVIPLESVSQVITQGVIVILIVMVLSIVWGLYGPAKAPKGPAPAEAAPAEPEAPAQAEMMSDDASTGSSDDGDGDGDGS